MFAFEERINQEEETFKDTNVALHYPLEFREFIFISYFAERMSVKEQKQYESRTRASS
jgi:hypothetical protein